MVSILPGLLRLLKAAIGNRIDTIYVAHRDRLCRFAFPLIEWWLQQFNVNIVVVKDDDKDLSIQDIMVQDILSIITVFSCKINGKRRYNNKARRASCLKINQ